MYLMLLFSVALLSTACFAEETPVVTAPQAVLTTTGVPDWSAAPEVTGFRLIKDGRLASFQPHARICYDAHNLYVRLRCPVPDAAKLTGTVRERDGGVWQDDAVELFLDPGKTGAHSYQFIVNCKGSRYDGRDGGAGWNGEWSAKSVVSDRDWICTITIPFTTLDRETPATGEEWGVNFCSDSVVAGENSSWAYTAGKYDQPARFGVLRFQPAAPAIGLADLHNFGSGPGHLDLSFHSRTAATLKLTARLGDKEHVLLDASRSVSLQSGAHTEVGLDFKADAPGNYSLDLIARSADGAVLYATHTPVAVMPRLQLTLHSFPTAGIVEAAVNASVIASARGRLRAVVTALAPDGKQLDRHEIESLKAGRGTTQLNVSAATGTLTIKAQVADDTGKVIGETASTVVRPPTPEWVHTRAGLTDKVLRPFEPVRTSGDMARIWGRTLTYGKHLLPESITDRDHELLAAPVRFSLRSDNRQDVIEIPGATKSASQLSLVRQGQVTAGGLRFQGKQTLDYDGCIKLELSVSPVPPVSVQELTFEIPLRPEVARYLHTCRADWANSLSEAIPKEGWKHKFMPFLWVGDEDHGLAWFTETDEPFHVADPNAVLEIVPGATATLLRVHVIDMPTELRQPFQLVFGLEPTPVKPVPLRKAHIWHGASYAMVNQSIGGAGYLKLPAAGNIDLRHGTLETVFTLDFDPEAVAKAKENQTLFHLAQANGDQVFLFWDYPDHGIWFYLGLGKGYPQKYPIHLSTRNLDWKKGETHHVALTWGDRTTLYLDGKAVASSPPHDGWMSGPLTDESMAFGSDVDNDHANWIINAVKIMPRPASAEAIAAEAARVAQTGAKTRLAPTPDTLVLYHPRAAATTKSLPAVGPPDRITAGMPALGGGATVEADGVHLGSGSNETMLDLMKADGVEVIVYHQSWTDNYGYPQTTHGAELKALIQACHARGIKLLLYFGYGLGNLTPEMKIYHDEWTVWPLIFWGAGQPESQQFDAACNRSLESTFLLNGISKLLGQYDIDGVYLDGTTEPFGCINHFHGCGYERDGAWKPTYPIWATREFMRRLAGLFQAKRKDYLIDVHMSANMTIPTLAFADSYWDGEQFESYVHGQKDPRALLPLDAFRTEFMGRQWGLAPEFLVYEGHPFTTEEALSFTLLHNVLVRATGLGDKLALISSIWKARDAFGVEGSEFLPYWNNGALFTPAPDGIYVSAYRRPDKGLLLVVSNLGKQATEATVTIKSAAVQGISGDLQAVDALNGDRISLRKGAGGTWILTTPLAPLRWRMIRVDPHN